MLFISLLVYIPLGIYCSSVSEDSSTSFTHPWNSIRGYLAATSTPIVPPIPRKDLPVGSDFKRIITENMIYIDKTDIIHRMITKEVYVFLSRPPRFGKSLLVSTLSYLFNGNSTNEKLFEGTKIKETFGDKKFPEYTVLRFDFAPVASSTLQAFNTSLRSKVGNFMIDYGTHKQGCVDKVDLKDCLEELLNGLWKKTGRQNVVLIDEYDHPWRNFRGKESDRPEMLAIMRDFFVVLKSSDTNMRFCFVTGSTKIALTEFFSGYNCATDISWFPEYETIVGFSESELKEYFHEYVEDEVKYKSYSSTDEVYRILNDNFEGFRFSLGNKKMYNSQEAIDFFKSKAKDVTTYQKRTESKYVVEMIQKVPNLAFVLDSMNKLTANDVIPVGVDFIRGFKDQFNDPLKILKVLYEGGILSIKGHELSKQADSDKYFIGFTNQVSRSYYHSLIKDTFPDFPRLTAHMISDPGFKEPLQKRDIRSFLERLDSHFMEVPYYPTRYLDRPLVEAIFQVVLFYGLRLSQMEPFWETVLQIGRLDVRTIDDNTVYTFELKRESNAECETVMYQCEKYSNSPYYEGKQIVCIGIIFHDDPVETTKAIAAWGMFEKYPNGTFVSGWDSPAVYGFTRTSSLGKNNV